MTNTNQTANIEKTKVFIFTDFDGTVTQRDGQATVFSPFYQSLLQGYREGMLLDYKHTPMLSEETVLSLFKKKFGEYNLFSDRSQPDFDMLMSPEAVSFFHNMLKIEGVTISIVTKNRKEYIQCLLKYHGFKDAEIAKINIMDSGLKNQDVTAHLEKHEQAQYIYVLDDSSEDYYNMMRAAIQKHYTAEQIKGHNEKPGQFKWAEYQKEIKQIYGLIGDQFDLSEQQQEFDNFLDSLDTSMPWLASGKAQYAKAADVLTTAKTNLKTAGDVFFNKQSPNAADFKQFQESCTVEIKKMHDELHQHRGIWFQINPIIRGILGVLATVVTVLAIVIVPLFLMIPGVRTMPRACINTFFSTPETKSGKMFNELVKEQFDENMVNITQKLIPQ